MEDHSYIDPDADEERLEARLRMLGTRTPRCCVEGCLEHDPFALTGAEPNLICVEHLAEQAGKSALEQSHTAGRANLPNDRPLIPANDHSVETHKYQAAWPVETLRNTDGSPLLCAAAAVRGWLDHLRLILERTVGWVPTALEQLDTLLRQHIGPTWWVTIGWNTRP